MKLILSLFLLAGCSCATVESLPVRFSPERTAGPFYCFTDGDRLGLVCLDFADFMTYVREHPELRGAGEKPRSDL